MAKAKDIHIAPVKAADANALVKSVHYSGKVVQNSQLHLGVFLGGRMEGVMQFGPSLDKRKIQGLVAGTGWNGFIELNRMAFSDRLPRNSESRALSIAFKIIKKHYPHIEWVVSFADGAQCGDGTIYRASGFVLTGIKKNNSLWAAPTGEVFPETSLRPGIGGAKQIARAKAISRTRGDHIANGGSTMRPYIEAGFKPIPGFQLRYIYFLYPDARDRLTIPILPFSKIEEVGASMYRGNKRPKQAMAGSTGTAEGQHLPGRSIDEAQDGRNFA
jgi:hypothetical protein